MVGQRHIKPGGEEDDQAPEHEQGPSGNGNGNGNKSNGSDWPTARSLIKSTAETDEQYHKNDGNKKKKGSDDDRNDSPHPHPDMHKKTRAYADRLNKPRQKPGIFRFSDNEDNEHEEQRREYIKKNLIEGIEAEQLNEYRKSKEQIKEVKNKKIRKFYEKQNERLNDWLEVDALVESMSSQVFDSMDPDPDHDGVRERGGALQQDHDDLEALLPEEERKSRQKGEKRAKIAINVGYVNSLLETKTDRHLRSTY